MHKRARIYESFGELYLVDAKTGEMIAEGGVLEGRSWKTAERGLKEIADKMGIEVEK